MQKPLGIAPGLSLSPVIGITDSIKYPKLRGAISITTATIENSTYALVASFSENGVQIINIDDPYNPTNVSSISDGTRYPELQDAHSITTTTIEGSTYALVASRDDDGVQIINIDDPYNPTNVSSISDGTKYPELEGAISITTTTIGGSTYALVASRDDDGVQIINITDPYTPTNASSITDGPRYPKLQDAHSITTTTIEGSTYALVASRDDDGVQIINITDPYTPTNASSITDGPRYPTLQGASSITTTTIGGSTYALVTAFDDYGVQIINITDPYTPTNASSITDSAEYPKLNDPLSITSTTIGETLSITEVDLPFNVFVDTIRPRIKLDGNASYSISLNTTNSFIPNVTITDKDPNYSGKFTLVPNATLDTSLFGSVYNYTYTADADNAGNLGESVSRIITITEVDPITVTSLSITSSSGNNFARADQNITIILETNGSNITNAIGTILNKTFTSSFTGGSANFTFTVPDDINGNATFSIKVTNSYLSHDVDKHVGRSTSMAQVSPTVSVRNSKICIRFSTALCGRYNYGRFKVTTVYDC